MDTRSPINQTLTDTNEQMFLLPFQVVILSVLLLKKLILALLYVQFWLIVVLKNLIHHKIQ